MNIKIDLSIVLLLTILKFTIAPQLPVIVIFLPLMVGFLFNFTCGVIDGWKDRNR